MFLGASSTGYIFAIGSRLSVSVAGSVQLATTSDRGRKLIKHLGEHRRESLSPKAFDPLHFGTNREPTSEPKVARVLDSG